ncbi:hypothetical protein [Pseudomonas aeruginosa]|uniref:hypothetical protein n=1 Tax=Pseudomonas aeruginosa TaxID=287 RepID=UPI001A2415FA|nr:hypothetical protein [Pseudomonas aeruginosa]ELO1025276.1 hypothetical protein [Pseudomonas aeruginosa]MBI8199304.1 hypothetical protein [Pseudomonas aeruginosa]HBO3037502.1 hypothetical protein [Pseudomonas aeruginosa]HDQ4135356.1 hypothetical protein [Pseudomonas aeruginosa]
MKWLLRFYIALIGADLAALAFWMWKRLHDAQADFTLVEISPFLVAAGVIAALLTLGFNQARSSSDDYLESASEFLSKAFETLDRSKDSEGRPLNDRMVWLTASRLLATSELIAEKIMFESHKLIWQEQQEYWRGRMRDLVSPRGHGFPSEYYAASPRDFIMVSGDARQPLSETSLAAIYRFIEWPKNRVDPLRKYQPFTDDELEEMAIRGPRGLARILQESRALRDKSN